MERQRFVIFFWLIPVKAVRWNLVVAGRVFLDPYLKA
jgi:hypothetical protein